MRRVGGGVVWVKGEGRGGGLYSVIFVCLCVVEVCWFELLVVM